jgi:hypothetical protein
MKYILFDEIDVNKIKNIDLNFEYIKQKIVNFFSTNLNIFLENISIEFNDNSQTLFIYILNEINIIFEINIQYNGEIIYIKKIEKIDRRKIDDLCELENFPIYLNNNYKIKVKGSSNIVLYDKILNIYKHLKLKFFIPEFNFNTPLFYKDKEQFQNENDNYIRFPFYDKKDKIAILLNRYSNGLNLCTAFVNIKENTIEQGKVLYCPNGLALEKSDEKNLKIYISYNDEIINYIYPEKYEQTSGWYYINIKEEFERT